MLKRVSIQNFKSLKDVTLNLQKVNLLIGPNNSGKSNFLKALEYFDSSDFKAQTIAALEQVSFKHERRNIRYLFDYKPNANNLLEGYSQDLGEILYQLIFELQIVAQNFTTQVSHKAEPFIIGANGDVISLESSLVESFEREFRQVIRTKVFRPDPSKLTKTAKFSADEVELSPNCDNLIAFYFYIDNTFKKYSNKIQNDLSRCIPEIAYFTTPPVKENGQSLLGLQFFDKSDIGYWADEVSEGVLYFLSLLCIINQPNPPKLLLLEEPEKGIHPRRIREIMEFIRRLVVEKDIQVIMTTHSPLLLDEFAESPESVFVFDKDQEGATFVRNLQHDIIEPANQKNRELGVPPVHYTDALGEYWTIGFLGGVPDEAL
ncbi:AAA family ATPase [Nibrella viscosa]